MNTVVRHISDRVGVMYLGRIVEIGSRQDVFNNPKHPYTRALLSAVPKIHQSDRRERITLEGDVPNPNNPPSGCYFHPRCKYATEQCKKEYPPLENHENRKISCWLPDDFEF